MVARLVRDQEVVGSSPVTSTKKTAEILLCGFLLRRNGARAATWSQHKRAIAQSGPHKKGAAFFMGEEALRRDFVRSEATDRRAKPAPTKGPRGRGFKSRHLNQKNRRDFALRFFCCDEAVLVPPLDSAVPPIAVKYFRDYRIPFPFPKAEKRAPKAFAFGARRLFQTYFETDL